MSLSQQQGMSLIELMIALLIGLVLTGAVTQLFVASRVAYSAQSALAELQENARFALEYLGRDIRKVGYLGCFTGGSVAVTVRVDGEVPQYLDMDAPLAVVDDYNSANPAGLAVSNARPPLAGSDLISLKFADMENRCVIEKHTPESANLHCYDPNPYKQGQILLATDCRHAAVFQQSNVVQGNANTKVIAHNSGNGISPGNCSKGLGLPVDCTPGRDALYTFSSGEVYEFLAYTYYVASGSSGEPALFRMGLSHSTKNAAITYTASELVEGVEDMQISYGVDSDGDGAANYYVAAGSADMSQVIAVRVSLLLRSRERGVVPEPQSYSFNGSQVTAPDTRLRKVFTTTIALRNRL